MGFQGKQVWREFTTDGVSSSGKHKPKKPEIIAWATLLETGIEKGIVYRSTKAALALVTDRDLYTRAIVEGDPTPANNGKYFWDGDEWVYDAPLDAEIGKLLQTNNDANDIVAVANGNINALAATVYTLNLSQNNTGPMTLDIGNGPLPLRSYPGIDAPADMIVAHKPVLLERSGAEYIIAAGFSEDTAQAQAAAAQAAQDANRANASRYDTLQDAIDASIPADVKYINVFSYSPVVDGGGGLYKKVDADPENDGSFQSTDGAWWELAEIVISPKMFGAVGNGIDPDNIVDDTTVLLNCFLFAHDMKRHVELGPFIYGFSSTMVLEKFPKSMSGVRALSGLVYIGANAAPGNLIEVGSDSLQTILDWRDFHIGSKTQLTNGWALYVHDVQVANIDLLTNGSALALGSPYGGNLHEALRLDHVHYSDLKTCNLSSQWDRLTANDCIEINANNTENFPVVPGQGRGVHIAGGVGGFHGQGMGMLADDINVVIDTQYARTANFTGDTDGTDVITDVTNVADLRPGMTINGAGIPTNAYITAVDVGASTVTISEDTTATADNTGMSAFNGNLQIFLNYMVADSPVNGSIYVNDSTVRPTGKILNCHGAFLSNAQVGSGLTLENWGGGDVIGIPEIRNGAGFGINIVDTSIDLRIGDASFIAYNALGGIHSAGDIVIHCGAKPKQLSGLPFSENITRIVGDFHIKEITIPHDEARELPPNVSGMVIIAADGLAPDPRAAGQYLIGGGIVKFLNTTYSFFVPDPDGATPTLGTAWVYFDGKYKLHNYCGVARKFHIKVIATADSA